MKPKKCAIVYQIEYFNRFGQKETTVETGKNSREALKNAAYGGNVKKVTKKNFKPGTSGILQYSKVTRRKVCF